MDTQEARRRELALDGAGSRFPNRRLAALAFTHDHAAVWRKRARLDLLHGSREWRQQDAGRRPYQCPIVVLVVNTDARTDDSRAVGRELHRPDPRGVPGEQVSQHAGRGVPEPHGPIFAARGDQRAVRRQGGGPDRVLMAPILGHRHARVGVPHAGDVSFAGREQARAIGGEDGGLHVCSLPSSLTTALRPAVHTTASPSSPTLTTRWPSGDMATTYRRRQSETTDKRKGRRDAILFAGQ